MREARPAGARPAEQFATLEQQHEVARLGMWAFLATEVLFFGGLFLAYAVYRQLEPEAFQAAGRHTDIVLGTLNTTLLLTSSAAMALAVQAAEAERRRVLVLCLAATALLGLLFLGLKGVEYAKEIGEGLFPGRGFRFDPRFARGAEMFFVLYFVMTGLHAVHITIGIALLSWTAWRAHRGDFEQIGPTPVTIVGLYWHFVDLVWVFLFPLLYLNGRGA